ncbi:beta-galactosidase [Paenibacillus ferrarius]|uniref:beta-galactosidase n=1 Tax=Paenibacillus ferrarius TaxID=1469647 RepID=UPI003D2BB8D3
MKSVRLRIDGPNKEIRPGKLSANNGRDPYGRSFGFTNFYMTKNGAPTIPVVGEFHFSRFSYLHWEEELLKMKAGGVNIIATYVFWIFHEEDEGIFEWGGERNLRHFVDLCAKHDLPLILRIGPFCHGEVRNGGIPDWIFNKPLEIRSNDANYLFYARRLYREIAKQVKGTFFQEGGPIIAVQLENEFMHCGAPLDAWGYKNGVFMSSGKGGNEHLAELRRIAEEAGMRPIFFTVTAWGGAAVPESDTLPMLAGYAYTPWIPNQPPSKEFIYRDLHVTPAERVHYDTLDYPVAYCEMAGGMQVSYHARPFVPAESVEAMTLVKLASGSNLLGYYMYHGGSNPVGKKGYLNEYALPKITYDYQSPLGEFGRIGDSYDRIRAISLFVQAFGDVLAPMGTVVPEGQSDIESTDTESLRWCVRQSDGAGFVFLNNFQDHMDMPDHNVKMALETARGTIRFPSEGHLLLKSGTCAVLPFGLDLAGVHLISATAQLLTKLESNGETVIVFFAHDGLAPEYLLSKSSVSSIESGAGAYKEHGDSWVIHPAVGKQHQVVITRSTGHIVRFVTLTRSESQQAYRFNLWGEDRLVISNSSLIVKNEQLICTSQEQNHFEVSLLPAFTGEIQFNHEPIQAREQGLFTSCEVSVPAYEPVVNIQQPFDHIAILDIDSE